RQVAVSCGTAAADGEVPAHWLPAVVAPPADGAVLLAPAAAPSPLTIDQADVDGDERPIGVDLEPRSPPRRPEREVRCPVHALRRRVLLARVELWHWLLEAGSWGGV